MDIKISTITLSTQLPFCNLNLTNIGKYLDIDDEIIGLKYNYAEMSVMKGEYSTTVYKKSKNKNLDKINKKLFYNQITIIFNNNGNNINIKLFANGSLHLTGCKSIEDGYEMTKKLYLKLKNICDKKDIILLTKDTNGILLDKDNLIYSYDKHKIIGFCKKDDKSTNKLYVINKKEFIIDTKTNMFITNKMETQRRRFIHNLNGEYIGFSKIELLKNRQKFYKKNVNIYFDIENGLIYHNNDLIIGKIVYNINNDLITDKSSLSDILEIEYNCNPFVNKDYGLNIDKKEFKESIDLNVNCINVYFNIGYKINRQRLYENLIELNYICKYKPESYSGIKLIYKIGINGEISLYTGDLEDNKSGICNCSNNCTCVNVTFLIFQSGNVIVSGFKSTEQIKCACDNFIDVCNKIKNNIQKREFMK
jgi:TATA-box binding protein (TBP) (component of TFIID and TFIIIB)